jgi:TetR/AcrR family transcriptional regulator, transcriptional repressor for nem operon
LTVKTTGHIYSLGQSLAPKLMPKPNVREKVVLAGLEQFHRLGFNGCSVEDITSFAGVPKGSFYNHFESKEDLALHAMERYREAGLHKSLGEQNRSPVKRLEEYFSFLSKAFIDSDNSKGCLFGNLANEMADHSPAIRERLKSIFVDWTQVIASVIRDGQVAGEITSSQKPRQLAGFLLSAWEGTLVRARCTKDSSPLKDFNEIVFSTLLK